MRHLDLFSGIGGFSLAAQWVWGAKHEIVAFCEIDKFCQKVLHKHWPSVPNIDDIHNIKGDEFGTVDIVTGGFPCQPFSAAGNRRGTEDDRHLWPEMLRVIQRVKPTWIVGENVTGIITMELDQVLVDLGNEGYTTRCFDIPACAVGAWHTRRRVWVVANLNRRGWDTQSLRCSGTQKGNCASNANRSNATLRGEEKWLVEPELERVVYGVPRRLDKIRLTMLGNAIVPQVAAVIMQAIKDVDEGKKPSLEIIE